MIQQPFVPPRCRVDYNRGSVSSMRAPPTASMPLLEAAAREDEDKMLKKAIEESEADTRAVDAYLQLYDAAMQESVRTYEQEKMAERRWPK